MPGIEARCPEPAADSAVFIVTFLSDAPDVDNARFIGTARLTIANGKLTIAGRRYPSERHRRRISHGYAVTNVLVASIVGIALYPLACTYVYLANQLLTVEATLEFDLAQVCDTSCDWDITYFNIRATGGEPEIQFIAYTSSREVSVKLVAQLKARCN